MSSTWKQCHRCFEKHIDLDAHKKDCPALREFRRQSLIRVYGKEQAARILAREDA